MENELLQSIIDQALLEDITDPKGLIPSGDHSSMASIPETATSSAVMKAKQKGVVAGVDFGVMIFNTVDPNLKIEKFQSDGAAVEVGTEIMHISGSARSILRAERVALNFMQRMSGTATLTRAFVDAVEETGAVILDTRKTTPNLRYLDKWAVRIGGGQNHRYGLFDMVMLKDNHIDFAGGIRNALEGTQAYLDKHNLNLEVEVETRNIKEVEEVLNCGIATRIMLDNFSPEKVQEAVQLIDKRMETEVSGGVNLQTVRAYAEAGPDFISVGALTHSAGSLDISLISA